MPGLYQPNQFQVQQPEAPVEPPVDEIILKGTKITVPRFENGKTIEHEINIEEDLPRSFISEQINKQFPTTTDYLMDRVRNDTQKISREEFDFLKSEGLLGKGKEGIPLTDMIADAVASAGKGLWQTGVSALSAAPTALAAPFSESAQKQFFQSVDSLGEGMLKGASDLIDLGVMAVSQLGDDYEQYSALKNFQHSDKTFREGHGFTMEMDPETAAKAADVSGFLDPTVLMPVGKVLAGAIKYGGEQAVKSAAKSAMKETLEKSVASGAMPGVINAAGLALEAPGEVAIFLKNKLGNMAKPVAVGAAAGALAAMDDDKLKTAAYGAGIAGLYGAGRAARLYSRIAKMGDTLAADAVRKAAESLPQDAATRVAQRVFEQVPHSAFRVANDVITGAAAGAAIGAGTNALMAASDPEETGLGVVAEGIKGAFSGAAAGATMAAGVSVPYNASKFAKRQLLAGLVAQDALTRPEGVKVERPNMEPMEFPNAGEHWSEFFTRDDISEKDRLRMFSALSAAEKNGTQIVMFDNATAKKNGFEVEAEMRRFPNDRPLILINKDKVSSVSTIIEEINHSIITDSNVRDYINGLVKGLGEEGAINKIVDGIGAEYANALNDASPELGSKLMQRLADAKNPEIDIQQRFLSVVDMADEYISRGVAERLKGRNPIALAGEKAPWLSAALDKLQDNIVRAFKNPESGATFDPINKVFYKDGKLIEDPFLDQMADNFLDKMGGHRKVEDLPKLTKAQLADMRIAEDLEITEKQLAANRKIVEMGIENEKQITAIKEKYKKEKQAEKDARKAEKEAKKKPQIESPAPEVTTADLPIPIAPVAKKPKKKIQVVKPSKEDTQFEYRPRPEDAVDSPTDKKSLLNAGFNEVANILGTTPAGTAAGIGFGNLKDGTPIVFKTKLAPKEIDALSKIGTPKARHIGSKKNKPVYSFNVDPNEPLIKSPKAFVEIANAMNNGNVVDVSQIVLTAKNPQDPLQFRSNGKMVVLGVQNTQTGGLVFACYDASLLADIANWQKTQIPQISKALKEFNLKSFQDYAPVLKAYLENYSSSNPLPGVDLLMKLNPKASKESATIVKDLIHLSSNVLPRKGQTYQEGKAPGIAINLHDRLIDVDALNSQGSPVKTTLDRDRNIIQLIRADALLDAKPYAPDGKPMEVKANLENLIPNMRSNFSPGRGVSIETINNSIVYTDANIQGRIIDDGKNAMLFVGASKPMKFPSVTDAITWLNKKMFGEQKKAKPLPDAGPFMKGVAAKELGLAKKESKPVASIYGNLNPRLQGSTPFRRMS